MAPPTGWADLPFFGAPYHAIDAALSQQSAPILPPADRRFRALEICPPGRTRVVILGQDPYHTPGKADGLAFSIPQEFGGRLDSLGNIFKELQDDLGVLRQRTDLTDWAQQGVLLLNTALTVPQGKPKAHARLGWDRLTAEVLDRLSLAPRAFVLWGGPAQRFARHIHGSGHLVLTSAHPSPLSAYRGFFGSKPFSRINAWLRESGDAPIRWAEPEDSTR
ncbi:uracil-DNA glycosylase [Thalassococcus sp. BH17M4-6]|uniref:uracil-DNA glycosylase n=1 Tax=Thalassococcus sp. BH17M4-6 TaxID=3413148 RepID=UPI003BC09F12